MIKLHRSPMTRSLRIVWLLEELGLAYELDSVAFERPTGKPFAQKTPTGKVPTLEDDGVTPFESGAILEYILERYGKGQLAPAVGSPLRGPFLQWVHFAESTAFGGLGNIAWHTLTRQDADRVADAMSDYRSWATAALDVLERELAGREFVLGAGFSGADVMLGYTLLVARAFGVLSAGHPAANAYLDRLVARAYGRRRAESPGDSS
jgi:glutathione S-transferase